MTVGLAAATANAELDAELRGVAYSGNATPYLKLHTGDPGAAGTANASTETTRKALTFAAASAGSTSASQVSWPSWSAGNETISHVSIWTASTAGTFIRSGQLSASKALSNGDTLNVTVTASLTPIAA